MYCGAIELLAAVRKSSMTKVTKNHERAREAVRLEDVCRVGLPENTPI